jgi:hypothetical protein
MKAKVFSVKARGWDHIILSRPCQDAVKSYNCDDFAVAAVADGHGASLHFRSERGSKYAVNAAVKNLKRLFKKINDMKKNSPAEYADFMAGFEENKEALAKEICRAVHRDWIKSVYSDLEKNPFDVHEYEELPQEYIEIYTGDKKEYYCVAYGTTLAAFAVCKDFWLGIQLGDGNCVSIYRKDRICEDVPKDPESYITKNMTHSMCSMNAVDKFRFYMSREVPAAVFAVTDGITNSFNCEYNDKELFDYLYMVKRELKKGDFQTNVRKLKKGIYMLSEENSGDDVSISGVILK